MKPPIKGYKNAQYPAGSVTQFFGEHPELYRDFMKLEGHNGIDIVAPWGTPIYAVEDGLVVDVKDSPDGYGKHIRILSPVGADGIGNEWTYGHASQNLVKIGDQVLEGQEIQKMGNTGFVVSGSTPYWSYNPYAGTHLHLGRRLYKLSPSGWKYNQLAPSIDILNYFNGFAGAVDFKDLLDFGEDPEIVKGMQLTIISLLNQIIAILKAKK